MSNLYREAHVPHGLHDRSTMPLFGGLRLLSMLPFFAWPLGCRIALWVSTAAMVAGAIHLWSGMLREPSFDATPEAEAILLKKIADAQQRVAELGPLRQRLAKYEHTATTSNDAVPSGNQRASGVALAQASVSSANLLAWIEQQVSITGVSLQRFEPVAQSLHSDTDGREASSQDHEAFGRSARPARLPMARSAHIELEGSYPALYRFLHALATTTPPLLIDVFHLRPAVRAPDELAPTRGKGVGQPVAANGSRPGTDAEGDMGRLTLTARVDVVEGGRFRLTGGGAAGSTVGAVAGSTAGAAGSGLSRVNPFARRGLPATAEGARLLGVMASGRQQSALLMLGQDVMLVEVGQIVGDARLAAIGKDFVTLAPVAGLPLRRLVLRSEP